MVVQFNGVEIFPHAVVRERRGASGWEVLRRAGMAPPAAGTMLLGALEAGLVLTGRLRATSRTDLYEQIGAALEAGPPTAPAELVLGGKSAGVFSLVRVEPEGVVDCGRECSLAFTAVFGNPSVSEV